MSGFSITRPVYQLRAVNGVAYAGWFLNFFKINSDVPAEVYEDIACTVPACQPAELNSEGYICLYAKEGDYTVREYDTDMVLKNCFDFSASSGGGSSGSVTVVPTVQAMRELVAGSSTYIVAQGYDVYGDACGGEFDWIPTATNADDGVTWFAPVSSPAEGRYRRRNATALTMRMAGDPGTLDSSYETMTRLAAAAQSGDDVIFPPGAYKLAESQQIEFAAEVSARAESGATIDTADASSIKFNGTFTAPAIQVFTGELNVSFGTAQPLAFPEWYGAKADNGDTDNSDAFLALFASGALLYTLPGSGGYKTVDDVSPSIPGNAIFMAASDLSIVSGGVIVQQGLYSANGTINFHEVKAAIATFVTLSATDATITNLSVTTLLTALAANITNNLTVGGLLSSGPAKVKGGSSAVFGSVPSVRYVNPVAANNVGTTEQVLREFPVVANILNAVGCEIEFEAFGSYAANTNTKSVKLTLLDNVPIESPLIALAISPGTAVAYSWRMKGKVIIRSGTQYVLWGDGTLFIVSSNEALVFTDSGNVITAALAATGLTPIPNPTDVANGTVNATLTPHNVRNQIKGAIGVITPGSTLNQALSVRLVAQGGASNDITVDYFKVQLNPAP